MITIVHWPKHIIFVLQLTLVDLRSLFSPLAAIAQTLTFIVINSIALRRGPWRFWSHCHDWHLCVKTQPDSEVVSAKIALSSLWPPLLIWSWPSLAALSSLCDMYINWKEHVSWLHYMGASTSWSMQIKFAQLSKVRVRPEAWFWRVSLTYRWVVPATRSAGYHCVRSTKYKVVSCSLTTGFSY